MPSKDATYATGRRKTAIARVRLQPGDGDITINRRGIDDYLGRATSRMVVRQPLELTETLGAYDVWVNVSGGGLNAQAGAIRHGISRALIDIDEGRRPELKQAGFLTRDSRKKERKKYGLKGARARFQFSKR